MSFVWFNSIINLTQESDSESEYFDYDAKKSSDTDVALITSSDNVSTDDSYWVISFILLLIMIHFYVVTFVVDSGSLLDLEDTKRDDCGTWK